MIFYALNRGMRLCAIAWAVFHLQLSAASNMCGSNKYAVTSAVNPDTNAATNNARCYSYGNGFYCCYCKEGSYSPSGADINSEEDCVKCPIGSYMSEVYFSNSYGQCVLCPSGTYQPAEGQSSCVNCPGGKTTFVSNYLQGPSKNQQVGAIGIESCTSTPAGYLTKGYSVYLNTYDSVTGNYVGSTITVNYPSACNSFGKVLAIGGTGVNSESQCDFCSAPNGLFVAGGYTSLNVLSVCPPFTSCFSQYVYGAATEVRAPPGSDGISLSKTEYRSAASASCAASCPAGTGIAQVGDVKTCATCKKVLGLVSNGQGECIRCDRFSYPKIDGAGSCSSCTPFYPFTSRWNVEAAAQTPPTDKWALQNYADIMVQYRSCADFNHVETSLCLCLQPNSVLIICGLIAIFFCVNLLTFVLCSIGRQGREPDVSDKGLKKKKAKAETELLALAEPLSPTKTEPLSPAMSPTKSGMSSPTQQLPTKEEEIMLASESQDNVEASAMGTWQPVKEEEEEDGLPEPPKPVLVGWRVLIGLLAYILIPFVDNLTDVAFVLSTPFYNVALFIAFIVFLCLPGLFFFKTLLEKKAVPRFYIVPMPKRLIFDKYDSLYKTIVGCILLLPFLVLNSPVLLPWLIIGSLLYQSKAFAVRGVANLWIHIWTGDYWSTSSSTDADMQKAHERRQKDLEFAKIHPIDEKVLNESINSHVAFETGPLVAVQFINNSLSNSWTPLAYFSMAFSIFNALSGLYRIVYYRFFLKIRMEDIPIDFRVCGVSMFGKDTAGKLYGSTRTVFPHPMPCLTPLFASTYPTSPSIQASCWVRRARGAPRSTA